MDDMLSDALRSYRALLEDVRDEMPFSQYVSFKHEDARNAGGHFRDNAAKDVKDKLSVHKFKGDTRTPNELEEWLMKLEDYFRQVKSATLEGIPTLHPYIASNGLMPIERCLVLL